ncbi:DUF1127 domain-containing protein [Salinarimonas sp.]|uniref:DUF1127 domain-containing protein n=1 Tax=Salinarimonas sp. TaxID=2766526 RepID=UPI0032D9937B
MSGKTFPPAARSKGAVVARYLFLSLAATLAALWKAMINRRAVVRLSDLDDRLLRDVGVTRDDVRACLDTPYHVDPSHRLALRRLQGKAKRAARTGVADWRREASAAADARLMAALKAA